MITSRVINRSLSRHFWRMSGREPLITLLAKTAQQSLSNEGHEKFHFNCVPMHPEKAPIVCAAYKRI